MNKNESKRKTKVTSWMGGLRTFDIVENGQTLEVYRNGRQQVRIQIVILALNEDGSASVPLDEDAIKSIRLVRYIGSQPIPWESDVTGPWIASTDWKGYEYYPEFADARDSGAKLRPDMPSPTTDDYTYVKEIYVSTTDNVTLKIAAEITNSKGEVFRTNGTGEDSAKDQWVFIAPKPVSTYSAEAFQAEWQKTIVAGSDSGNAIYNYYCILRDDRGKLIQLRSFEVEPASMIKWRDNAPSVWDASYTGYGYTLRNPSGDTDAIFDIEFGGSPHRPDPVVRDPRPGRGVIVLVKRTDIPYANALPNPPFGPCRIVVVDEYGNEHQLLVAFNDWRELELRMG